MKVSFGVLCFVAICISFVNGQIYAEMIEVDGVIDGTQIPGDMDFSFLFEMNVVGNVDNATVCTFTFSHPTVLSAMAASTCVDNGGNVYDCNINWIPQANVSQTLPAIDGNIGVIACENEMWTVDYTCVNDGPDLMGSHSATLTSSASQVASNLVDVEITNDVVNYDEDPIFTVIARVNNANNCSAAGVRCTITYPEQYVSDDDPGLVDLIVNDANSTVTDNDCSLDGSDLICPRITASGYDIPIGQNLDIVMVFELTGNGTLDFIMNCTALGMPLNDVTNLTYTGVNVPPPPAPPTASSDDSDDVIVNTAIPLAIFGAVMICLWTIIIVTVVAYVVYSKLVQEESL